MSVMSQPGGGLHICAMRPKLVLFFLMHIAVLIIQTGSYGFLSINALLDPPLMPSFRLHATVKSTEMTL